MPLVSCPELILGEQVGERRTCFAGLNNFFSTIRGILLTWSDLPTDEAADRS